MKIRITISHKMGIDVSDKMDVSKRELRKIKRSIKNGTFCMTSNKVYLIFGKKVLFNSVVGVERFFIGNSHK